MKRNKEALVGYDFQGWPIFKLTLKELLLGLGGQEEDGKIVFYENNPAMSIYPSLLQDDGMGYGVNEECIVEASAFYDEDGKHYVNIFRDKLPSKEQQEKLFKRWDDEEQEVKEAIEKMKKNK